MLTKILEVVLNTHVLYALCCVLFSIAALFSFSRQLQMLQQNSYFPRRYTSWLKENEVSRFLLKASLFIFYSFLNLKNNAVLLCVSIYSIIYMVACIVGAVKNHKKSIIKLVFTARIKRMYGVYALLLTALCLLQILLAKGAYYWFLSLAFLLALLPYIAVYILWAVMYPAEKMITKHYIKDAKKILASFGGRLKIVGITGSYGKTGTKNILFKMLSEKYNTLTTPKNFNTPMGVVRTVRELLRPETEVFICEMGAKKAGDIKELCELVGKVDCGIITSVGPQHLDTFGDIRTVTNTKFELYDAVRENGGNLFANTDNNLIKEKSISVDIVPYGTDSALDFYADNIEMSETAESFELHLKGETVRVRTKLLGQHNILNIVGAAALAYSMGVSAKQIAFAVSRLEAVEHRLELKRYIAGSTLIDDAYNANPEGCLEACRVLSRFEGKKRIIVTPGLVELGEREYDCNFELGKTAAQCADIIILVGIKRSKPLADGIDTTDFDKKNLHIVSSFKEAQEVFAPMCDTNTVLLFENDLPDNYLK